MLSNDKRKITEDSDNKYKDDKVKKIKLNKSDDGKNDVTFVDKIPVHPRDGLKRLTPTLYLSKRCLTIHPTNLDVELKQRRKKSKVILCF